MIPVLQRPGQSIGRHKVAVVNRGHQVSDKQHSRLTFGVGHVFLRGLVECLKFNLTLWKFNKTDPSLEILESNSIKFSDGHLVEFVEASLIIKEGLFVNDRESFLIHPLVLAKNHEEQQADDEKAHRHSLGCTQNNNASKDAETTRDWGDLKKMRTVDVNAQLFVREV